MTEQLLDIYHRLLGAFGPQNWWPAESPFEMIIGAILTQNTNWTNVEKAIANLRAADTLSLERINRLRPEELEELIRPSGFFRQKARRLQDVARFLLASCEGDLERLFARNLDELRTLLLALPGIGPETADSILLYAAGHPSFVIDAYTLRIFRRLGLLPDDSDYDQARQFFMSNLPADPELFNEYHALVVRLAKEHCRKQQPRCANCPLRCVCRHGNLVPGD